MRHFHKTQRDDPRRRMRCRDASLTVAICFIVAYSIACFRHERTLGTYIKSNGAAQSNRCTRQPQLVRNDSLTQWLASKQISTSLTIPTWIERICPTVAHHFRRYPGFSGFMDDAPLMTGIHAAHSVCTLQIARDMASSIDFPLYLHAGTHLGALRHGGPVPWDDDVDAFMPLEANDRFLSRCRSIGSELRLNVTCYEHSRFIKMFITTDDSFALPYPWAWPFLDIWPFAANKSHIFEVLTTGERSSSQVYKIREYFPARPYFFGGLEILGPQPVVTLNRYKITRCILASWNHRLEQPVSPMRHGELDCCTMRSSLPFIYNGSVIHDGRYLLKLPEHMWF